MDKKNLMATAWLISKNSASKFGGTAKSYLSQSLKLLWKMNQYRAKVWQTEYHHRIYINDLHSLIGLEIGLYKTGSISWANFCGESISNTKAKRIDIQMSWGKLYFDINDGEFRTEHIDQKYAAMLLNNLTLDG